MILSLILLYMSAMQVDGNMFQSLKRYDSLDMTWNTTTADMMTEKQISSEIQCAMAASQNNCPLYCHGGTRCLLVEKQIVDEVLIQTEGTPMKDLEVNWQCKIDQGE